jgi:hypothetical protein
MLDHIDTDVLTTATDRAMLAYLELAEIAREEEAYANQHFFTPDNDWIAAHGGGPGLPEEIRAYPEDFPRPTAGGVTLSLEEWNAGYGEFEQPPLAHNPDDGGDDAIVYDCQIAMDCAECQDYNRCADLALMMEV